jgi:hypothetical protein
MSLWIASETFLFHPEKPVFTGDSIRKTVWNGLSFKKNPYLCSKFFVQTKADKMNNNETNEIMDDDRHPCMLRPCCTNIM